MCDPTEDKKIAKLGENKRLDKSLNAYLKLCKVISVKNALYV